MFPRRLFWNSLTALNLCGKRVMIQHDCFWALSAATRTLPNREGMGLLALNPTRPERERLNRYVDYDNNVMVVDNNVIVNFGR